MKNKLVFVSGMAVGFIVGIRAGRDSYENLKVKIRGLLGSPAQRDNVSDTARPPKEDITGVPPHDTTPHQGEATSGTPKHDRPNAYAAPESEFYGIGGPASHEPLNTQPAQQAHHDETGRQNRAD